LKHHKNVFSAFNFNYVAENFKNGYKTFQLNNNIREAYFSSKNMYSQTSMKVALISYECILQNYTKSYNVYKRQDCLYNNNNNNNNAILDKNEQN